jgi:erythromycin esterase
MTRTDEAAAAARQWIDESAHELATTDPAGALTDLKPLEALLADAVIVGVGQTTRAGREVTSLGHRVVRLLVERLGFRTLAFHDDESAVAGLDTYTRTGDGDPHAATAGLWRGWRSREMLTVVRWARSFNERNPTDPVRMVGLEPAKARPVHYRDVINFVAGADRRRLAELRRHYDTIITAHELDEHVQRARGIHPGRPFAEHARDAYELVASLPDTGGVGSAAKSAALRKARLIVDFHTGGIAADFDYGAIRRRSVSTMTAIVRDTGSKIALWDGMALTANAARLQAPVLTEPVQGIGNALRRQLGSGYVSLLIGFGHGDLGELHAGQRAPEPVPGSADTVLAGAGPERYLLDLHGPRSDLVADWLRGPHKLRIIAGIYDAAADAEHYVPAGRLDEWFDALLHVRTITPTTPL